MNESQSLVMVTGPTLEPVTVADAKLHLGVASDDSDAYIDSLLKAAVEWCEVYTRQSLLTTTWRQVLSEWPSSGVIELYRPPLQSVASVLYTDSDGAEQTLATDQYVVDTDSEPGRVLRGYGITWPTLRTQGIAAPVTINFISGHSAIADIPESFLHAIKLLVGHWYENREEITRGTPKDLPLAAKALLSGASHGSYP